MRWTFLVPFLSRADLASNIFFCELNARKDGVDRPLRLDVFEEFSEQCRISIVACPGFKPFERTQFEP